MSLSLSSRWWLYQKGQPARCTHPVASRSDGRCHNCVHQDGLCKIHLRAKGRGEFTVKAWGIYTGQKLLITCDSRASAEELLEPDETLVRVLAKCVTVKKGKR